MIYKDKEIEQDNPSITLKFVNPFFCEGSFLKWAISKLWRTPETNYLTTGAGKWKLMSRYYLA